MGTAQSSSESEVAKDYPEAAEGAPVRKDESLLPEELTSKFEVMDKIGTGNFGALYKVKDRKTTLIRAVKYVESNESTIAEVETQAKLKDPHVVQIFDTISLPLVNKIVIVMEYCEGGNLLDFIKRGRRHHLLNEVLIMYLFNEMCLAVSTCHQKKIIHRDIKPENILLDHSRKIKLANFGVARMLHRGSYAKSFCGTPPYMAPELYMFCVTPGSQGEGSVMYDGKCDVWSLGCVLWDMANSSNRFVHELSTPVGFRKIHNLVESNIPADYVLTKRLLHGMLKKDAEQRLSLRDILLDKERRDCLINPRNEHWSDVM